MRDLDFTLGIEDENYIDSAPRPLNPDVGGLLGKSPAADTPSGMKLAVDTIPNNVVDPLSDSYPSLQVEDIPHDHPVDDPEPEPFFQRQSDGSVRINRLPEYSELTPAARKLYGDNPLAALQALAKYDETYLRDEARRLILGNMDTAEQLSLPIPEEERNLREAAAKAGMSLDEARFWQQKNPRYLNSQIENGEVLRLSGENGYVTEQLQSPSGAEQLRGDAVFLAQLEADMLGVWGTEPERWLYELRSGFGQVGVFGVKGMAAVARLGADLSAASNDRTNSRALQDWRRAADWWNEYALDKQAQWVGPSIDTGSPGWDFVRESVFRGSPMLGAFMALSAIPGVGTGGSSAIMGSLMAGDTYLTLRNDGISPMLSFAAAAPVGLVSYATSKFTFDNVSRYMAGRSPLKLFSFGTGLEVLEEGGQEIIENTTQSAAEGLARMIGDPEYNLRKFRMDMEEGFKGAIAEGGMASITTGAMRLFGVPIAARNQMRARAFADTFPRAGAAAAKTEVFTRAPDVLAASLNSMARHHNGGPVFTSVGELTQAGVTREAATAPIGEGGLGLKAEAYDKAAVTGDDIAVGYGDAVVFSQKQKETGNAKAEEAFSANPDAMSVGDIRAQKIEAEAVIDGAEVHFQNLQQNKEEGTPLRLRVFRAGLRAAGYDAYQADALTAMYTAGAERHAQQWGTTVEGWLDLQNVQLMMNQALLSSGRREAQYYLKVEVARWS